MKFTLSPIRIIILFSCFILLSPFFLKNIAVGIKNEFLSKTFFISYSMPNTGPGVIEDKVTSILENSFSRVSQLKRIYSVSREGNGYIQLEFDKKIDINKKRFELSQIIQQAYLTFPKNVSFPSITNSNFSNINSQPLISYSVNAEMNSWEIKNKVNDILRILLSDIEGIERIEFSDIPQVQLNVDYNKLKCKLYGINLDNIEKVIGQKLSFLYPGSVTIKEKGEFFVVNNPELLNFQTIQNITISSVNNNIYKIRDIADVYFSEQKSQSYYRVRGKNAIKFSIFSKKRINELTLAFMIKDKLSKLNNKNSELNFKIENDNSETINTEIKNHTRRFFLAVLFLTFFLSIFYKNWRYVLILFCSVITTLSLTLIFARIFSIQLDIYSLSGLAVILGIVIDNFIVMLDHLNRFRNERIFPGILTNSLILIGSLCLVFFLPYDERKNLTDFSSVIIVVLISSLITVLFFIPALYSIIVTSLNNGAIIKNQLFSNIEIKGWVKSYYRIINGIANYRIILLIILIFLFGIPIYLLPSKIDKSIFLSNYYNQVIGGDEYQTKYKQPLEKYLGGLSRLFIENLRTNGGFREHQRTKLLITAEIPHGAVIEQLNNILLKFEQGLEEIEGLDNFITSVNSNRIGTIEITFLNNYENSDLPYRLKSKLLSRSLNWDGVKWNIIGVGNGFTNKRYNDPPNLQVIMRGYNYFELERQAQNYSSLISLNNRVRNVNINEMFNHFDEKNILFTLSLNQTQISKRNLTNYEIVDVLSINSNKIYLGSMILLNGDKVPIVIKDKESDNFNLNDLLSNSIQSKSGTSQAIRLREYGFLKKSSGSGTIYKENRQYLRLVSLEYLGNSKIGDEFLLNSIEQMENKLPIGYSIEKKDNPILHTSNSKYYLALVLILIIYIICGVFFENILKPLYVIALIPLSYLGIFGLFGYGEIYFDQGGYASFILVSALVSNASLLIFCEFKLLSHLVISRNKLIILVLSQRSKTIFLTSISTILAMIPFLIDGSKTPFWYSLAIGTIGGTIASLFAIFIILPILFWVKSKPSHCSNIE